MLQVEFGLCRATWKAVDGCAELAKEGKYVWWVL